MAVQHSDADLTADLRKRTLQGLPVTDRRVELAGIPTAILEGGDGPPLILLHGQGEFAATWAPVIAPLAETNRLWVADLPGHGASGTGDGRLDADRAMAWLAALVEHTGAARPAIAGHLLGGAIALRYALERGGTVGGLVLVDTLGLARYWPSPGFTVSMVRFVARPTERSRDRLFDRCFTDYAAVREEFGDRWQAVGAYAIDRARSPELKAALRSLMPKVGMPALPSERLQRIAVRPTLIHGRGDLQVKVGVAEEASRRYGWPLHVIEGVRDDPAVEQPAAFLEALRTALADSGEQTGRDGHGH